MPCALNLLWCAIAERLVNAFPVVEQLDIIEDGRSGVVSCGEVAVVDEFVLEAGEEALRHRVVIRALPATHAGSDAAGTQLLPVAACAIWRTAIRVMNQPRRRLALDERHGERRLRQCLPRLVAHRPAHDTT